MVTADLEEPSHFQLRIIVTSMQLAHVGTYAVTEREGDWVVRQIGPKARGQTKAGIIPCRNQDRVRDRADADRVADSES